MATLTLQVQTTTTQSIEHESERRAATEEEVRDLRHVVDNLPFNVWIALIASTVERFTYYAVSTPWQNYIQHDPNDSAIPGALGLGQASATRISNAFLLFTYLAPMPFAILSDTWLGRFRTLAIGFTLDLCGCLVMFCTSLPNVTEESTKIAGLALAMVLLGLGTGCVKATISPFIGDQYTESTPRLLITKSGERVVTDRTLTIQYIYNVYYWFTNIASLSLIASTFLEKYVSFWAAFLLPLCSTCLLLPLLFISRKSLVKLQPQNGVLLKAAKVIACAARERFHLDAAKPAFQAERRAKVVTWDDTFVLEIKRGLRACRVMACFVPFYLCMSQISNNLISQAGQMRLDGFPSDAIVVLNPVACIILGPLIQRGLYPSLRKHGVAFGPIARMTFAFVTMSTAMAFAAGVQKLVYTRGPCYEYPLDCPASEDGTIPNDLSVWVQTPLYFLLAFAEVLGFATLYEYSYSEAPKNMRTFVQALGQVSSSIGSAFGIALSPFAVNPQVMYLYAGLAGAMIISAPIFGIAFSGYDKKED